MSMLSLNFLKIVNKYVWNFLLITVALSATLYKFYANIYRGFFENRIYDFYGSWLAAQALLRGTDLYKSGDGGYIYPPFYAFLITPLAHLPEKFAHIIWLSISLSLIPIVLILGFRVAASGFQLNVSRWQAAGACALAVLLSQDQIRLEFIENQNDLLILAGFALALYWLDRKPYLAGVSLGLTATIKYQGLLFLPFLILRGRWRVIMGLMAGVATAAFLPALMIGWDRNLAYLKIALLGITNMTGLTHLPVDQAARLPALTWGFNVSISSGMMRIFRDLGWQQSTAWFLLMGIAIFVILLMRWMFQRQGIAFFWRTPQTFRNPQQEKMIVNLEWCALLILMLAFTQGTRRHFILLLNVNLLAAVMLLFPRPQVKRWPLLVGILIAQFGEMQFILPPAFKHFSMYAGLPGWGFLIFLPILINTGLAYYRDIYGNKFVIATANKAHRRHFKEFSLISPFEKGGLRGIFLNKSLLTSLFQREESD